MKKQLTSRQIKSAKFFPALLFLIVMQLSPVLLYSQTWDWVSQTTEINSYSKGQYGARFMSSVADNTDNSIYVTGFIRYNGSVDFGNGVVLTPPVPVTTGFDKNAFIAKYNSSGVVQWAKLLGTPVGAAELEPYDMAMDNKGNVYITGKYWGYITFGQGVNTLESTVGDIASDDDVFVLKCDKKGNVVWAQGTYHPDVNGTCRGYGITVDTLTNTCALTGIFNGNCTFFARSANPITVSGSPSAYWGSSAMFIAQIRQSDGDVIWVKNTTCKSHFTEAYSITTLSDGYCVAGAYNDTTSFGPYTLACPAYWMQPYCTNYLQNTNVSNAFVAKYAKDGHILWAKSTEGKFTETAVDIASDGYDNVYVTGSFEGDIYFDNILLYNTISNPVQYPTLAGGTKDGFICKYNTNGQAQWAKKAGGPDNDFGSSIFTTPRGESYITGGYWGTVDFGNGNTLTSVSNNSSCTIPMGLCTQCPNQSCQGAYCSNLFVAEYDQNGNTVFAKGGGEGSSSSGEKICLNAKATNCYVTGNFFIGKYEFDNVEVVNNDKLSGFVAHFGIGSGKRYAHSESSNEEVSAVTADVYPNPFSGNAFTLDLHKKTERVEVTLVNAIGTVVFRQTYFNTAQVELQGIENSGVYTLVAKTAQATFVKKVIRE